ncbi:MAG: outer membrane beta-barrel protein [Prevotella sp.]|nr:outer membrane beta-barrel protein [Prevotella sp.]
MKKIFMMAVMAAATLTANAQWWVGGELELTGEHRVGADKTKSTFGIKPEVGYSLNDKMDVALALGYTHSGNFETQTQTILGTQTVVSSSNQFIINPYLRYKFVKAGNFFAFVDGGVQYSTTHVNGIENNINTIGVAIVPGIAYSVSSKVTLVSKLGDGLYFNHAWQKDTYHQNNYGFKFANAISFGAYYSF